MNKCCNHKSTDKKCVRKDGKVFNLPRKFTRHTCVTSNIKGFSKRSSCAPYKHCKKPHFGDYNVYINRNPNNTIQIKYTTLQDVRSTIKKLEKLYAQDKYVHQRIWQVGMIMYVRLRSLKMKKPKQYNLAKQYYKFLGQRTKLSQKDRKLFKFKFK